jgi:hypothetical protein
MLIYPSKEAERKQHDGVVTPQSIYARLVLVCSDVMVEVKQVQRREKWVRRV